MKTKLLLLTVSVIAFASCSTIYKTGQTPDDVYYSPAREYYDEVQTENNRETANERTTVYNSDDRMIRMGIADARWRYLNYDYGYSPYDYSYYNRFNSNHGYYGSSNYYNGYGSYYGNVNDIYFNNYYYNPFYNPYPVYIQPATVLKNSTPRVTNLNGYNHIYNNANTPSMSVPAAKPIRNYNNSNRSSGLGNILDKVLSPSSGNNNNTNNSNNTTSRSTPERTYTPPSSNSNSSSGSSSSGSSSGGSRITRPN
jgi:hypothetical protein